MHAHALSHHLNVLNPVPVQAAGCATELSPEEVEEGEVDQLVKRLVTLANEVSQGVGLEAFTCQSYNA